MTTTYVLGKSEADQFWVGTEEEYKEHQEDGFLARYSSAKQPRPLVTPIVQPPLSITKIVTGGMHSVALASDGSVYTWGNNDDGALGRTGIDVLPNKVEGLPAVTDIGAGDNYTIAYNTDTNEIYFWGCYRTDDGKKLNQTRVPVRIQDKIFNSKTILKKIACGANHTIALSECGKIFGWGDPDFVKIKMATKTKPADIDAMKVEKFPARNAIDIFCGKYHNFYINNKHHVYSWGLNNWGQLGTGTRFNSSNPVRIKELDPFEGDYVT
jgi:regulator of chromosome condensation